jgi:GAF domain-containing protein
MEPDVPTAGICAPKCRDISAIVDGERNLAMRLENGTLDLELIAETFQIISKEISYEGLAKALKEALSHSWAARGGVLPGERGEPLAKADAGAPRERARFFTSHPVADEFRLPANLSARVLARQETGVRQGSSRGSAFIAPAEPPPRNITQLCLPLVHQERTIGVLYPESERRETFTPRCVSVMSMLASQAAVSFEFAQLGDRLGLALSIYRKIIAVQGRPWVEENTAHGARFTFARPLRRSVSISGRN